MTTSVVPFSAIARLDLVAALADALIAAHVSHRRGAIRGLTEAGCGEACNSSIGVTFAADGSDCNGWLVITISLHTPRPPVG